jgi:ABC-2 type transport system ATP-binding protein
MSSQEVAIAVKDVSKTFKLPHERQGSLKNVFIDMFRGKRTYEKQRVLQDITFDIKQGEFFGIVGRNGSGKSTLLKLLAGIYTPDKGGITINGKLTPFIELGVGFNPELTGRENVFLNGALLGFSRPQMEEMYDEIVAFAELEKFMDQALKNYSSGMQVRLAFSIAIRANTEILLLDEVLAVGDENFQKKCYEYFAELKKDKKTVILVSHDMNSVQRFCTKAMLVHDGEIKMIGKADVVAKEYEEINRDALLSKRKAAQTKTPEEVNKYVDVKIKTVGDKNKATGSFLPEERLIFEVEVKAKETIEDAFVGFSIRRADGEIVYWITTEEKEHEIKVFKAGKPVKLTFDIQNIYGENSYMVDVSVKSNDRTKQYFSQYAITEFNIIGKGKRAWVLNPEYSLKISD